MKIVTRKNGTVRVEVIGEREWYDPEVQIGMCIYTGDIRRNVRVGDEGVLVERQYFRSDAVDAYLWADPDGVPGNSNPAIKRLNGWRGTTNDVATFARGWRQVESISPRKRGVGVNIVLSAEFVPDA